MRGIVPSTQRRGHTERYPGGRPDIDCDSRSLARWSACPSRCPLHAVAFCVGGRQGRTRRPTIICGNGNGR